MDALREQTRAKEHAAREQSAALHEVVSIAAERAKNPLLALELEKLRAMSAAHKLGENVNGWQNPFPASHPKSLLLQYQFEYWHDESRFKAWLASRQCGKDFSSEGEAAEDCFLNAKHRWMIAAPSERQSLASLDQQKLWCEAFGLIVDDHEEEREHNNHAEAMLKAAKIVYHNGSDSIAVPGRPDTVRGESRNVLLTEWDFFDDPAATWRALFASITNPLRGGVKKIRGVSTPNGKGRMLDKIFNAAPDEKKKVGWSKHLTTIHHAVLMGLPVNIEEMREMMDDPDGFAQEFECAFIDGSNVLLPYELIANAESFDASEIWDEENAAAGPIFCGVDFGRSNDPTVCWTLQKVQDVLWTREVLVLDNTPTPEQETILDSRLARASRASFDYTGPGIGLGDYLVRRHGRYDPAAHSFGKVELVTFSAKLKRELFPRMRRQFEPPTRLRVPVSRAIREDLHGVQQTITNGEYSYWSPRTKAGHSDRATALALAIRASGGEGFAPVTFSRVKRRPRSALGMMRRMFGF